MTGLAAVIARSGSLPTAAVLSCVYIYAWLQRKSGYNRSQSPEDPSPTRRPTRPRTFQTRMASTWLARHPMRFRMRDGAHMGCRIVDSGALLSVHVDRDYDIPGLDWSKARTIVDVGAHVGSFTVWAALRSPSARLLAVEPNPETFRFLLQNLRDNGLQDRVRAINAAVGATSGVASLELTEHSLGTRLARSGEGPVRVKVMQMEQLLKEAGMDEVDVLKMDCEGMEFEVFGAMSPNRLRLIKAITCEYHPEPGHDPDQLDAILQGGGFTVHRRDAPLGIITAVR